MKNEDYRDRNAIISVNDLHLTNTEIRAEDFRSPLIRRLCQSDTYQDGQSEVCNCFRNSSGNIIDSTLLLTWSDLAEDYKKCLNTYQIPVITEFATIGLTCILLNHNTGLEITEVTRRGDKADYWVGDREAMVEISGQQDGSITDLCDRKAEQLLENPFGQSGYVCVAIYCKKLSRLWFYLNNEGN